MRIAYIHAIGSPFVGTRRKIEEQVLEWRRQGHEVFLCARSSPSATSDHLGCQVVVVGRSRHRLTHPSMLVNAMKAIKPDLVYLRVGVAEPGYRTMFRKLPVCGELNSDDLREFKLTLPWPLYLYHWATRKRVWSHVRGFVCLTQELASQVETYGVPTEVVPDGIDLNRYEVLPPADNTRPGIFFMGSAGIPWHGVNDILRLAANTPHWDYHIVGLATVPAASRNVRFYGPLDRNDYPVIMRRCDVALGTLGLYLKGLNEACTLKSRECLAYGLPMILGHKDADFPNKVDFLLTVPNRPGGALELLEEIKSFVGRWRSKRVPRRLIDHLDVRVKETQRLTFLQSLVHK